MAWLQELKTKGQEAAELEDRCATYQAELTEARAECGAVKDALFECETDVEHLQTAEKRRAMEHTALVKAMAREKAARASAEQKVCAHLAELNTYRQDAVEHAAALSQAQRWISTAEAKFEERLAKQAARVRRSCRPLDPSRWSSRLCWWQPSFSC